MEFPRPFAVSLGISGNALAIEEIIYFFLFFNQMLISGKQQNFKILAL
jgi:hypothetical protein